MAQVSNATAPTFAEEGGEVLSPRPILPVVSTERVPSHRDANRSASLKVLTMSVAFSLCLSLVVYNLIQCSCVNHLVVVAVFVLGAYFTVLVRRSWGPEIFEEVYGNPLFEQQVGGVNPPSPITITRAMRLKLLTYFCLEDGKVKSVVGAGATHLGGGRGQHAVSVLGGAEGQGEQESAVQEEAGNESLSGIGTGGQLGGTLDDGGVHNLPCSPPFINHVSAKFPAEDKGETKGKEAEEEKEPIGTVLALGGDVREAQEEKGDGEGMKMAETIKGNDVDHASMVTETLRRVGAGPAKSFDDGNKGIEETKMVTEIEMDSRQGVTAAGQGKVDVELGLSPGLVPGLQKGPAAESKGPAGGEGVGVDLLTSEGSHLSGLENVTEWSTEESCIVCFGEYEVGQNLCRLPCRHVYHAQCIDEWLDGDGHTWCPLCKCDLLALVHGRNHPGHSEGPVQNEPGSSGHGMNELADHHV